MLNVIILFGATETAGSVVAREAIIDPEIDQVTIVVCKAINLKASYINQR